MKMLSEQELITGLRHLFRQWSGSEAEEVLALPRSGSDRRYFRMRSQSHTAMGAWNPHQVENEAFIGFTRHFSTQGLPVPELYAEDLPNGFYLQQDLGDTTLLKALQKARTEAMDTMPGSPPQAHTAFPEALHKRYRQALEDLFRFQTLGHQGLNYDLAWPRAAFDKQAMLWDLNYFKYYFLKLAGISFHEQELENDFQTLASYILKAPADFFMFRDFQSRNIMIHDDQLYYIDYQGGRRGPMQYDIASLLYQARAKLPQSARYSLLEHYLDVAGPATQSSRTAFKEHYQAVVLIRMLQVLGAYGFRGLYERKSHFLISIPPALKNLGELLDRIELPVAIPVLLKALRDMIGSPALEAYSFRQDTPNALMLSVTSFSYKKGLPVDLSGNGGGFIFDCRALHNPGRYQEYKQLTGMDASVASFLVENSRVEDFLKDVYSMVIPSIDRYLERGFTHLAISFGCTGGQHRSVYCAEQLSKHLNQRYGLEIHLQHREQGVTRHYPAILTNDSA